MTSMRRPAAHVARALTARALIALTVTVLASCGETAGRDDSAGSAGASATAADRSVARDDLLPDTGWVASPGGLGAIRTGMRRGALVSLLGQPSRAGYDTNPQCTYVGGSALPAGVQVMVADSTVARIDVREPGVRTREGIEVGDTEAAVLARYGDRGAVTPHKYGGPAWHYVTVTPPGDTLHRIVFETDGQVVRTYRVGRRPEVEWVEGCA